MTALYRKFSAECTRYTQRKICDKVLSLNTFETIVFKIHTELQTKQANTEEHVTMAV